MPACQQETKRLIMHQPSPGELNEQTSEQANILQKRLIESESERIRITTELATFKELANSSPEKRLAYMQLNGVTKSELFDYLFNTQMYGTTTAHYIAQGRDKALRDNMLSLISSLPVEDRVPFYLERDCYLNTLAHYFMGASMGHQARYMASVDLCVFDKINELPLDTINTLCTMQNISQQTIGTLAFTHNDKNAFMGRLNIESIRRNEEWLNTIFVEFFYRFNVEKLTLLIPFIENEFKDIKTKIFSFSTWDESKFRYSELLSETSWSDLQKCIQILPEDVQLTLLKKIGMRLSGESFIAYVNYVGSLPENKQIEIFGFKQKRLVGDGCKDSTPKIQIIHIPTFDDYFKTKKINESLALLTLLSRMSQPNRDRILCDSTRPFSKYILRFSKNDAEPETRFALFNMLLNMIADAKYSLTAHYRAPSACTSSFNLLTEETQIACLYLLCQSSSERNVIRKLNSTNPELSALRIRIAEHIKNTPDVKLQKKIQDVFKLKQSQLYDFLNYSTPNATFFRPQTYVDEIMAIKTQPLTEIEHVAAPIQRKPVMGFGWFAKSNIEASVAEQMPLLAIKKY